MVTPSVTLNHQRVVLGTPVEMTYKFVVAKDAKFMSDYHVMVHFGDQDGQLIYTDDHDPPTPTKQWMPGQTIEYTRTFWAPEYPYFGTATIEIGMYAAGEKLRAPMAGIDTGHRSYKISTFQLLPQNEGVQAIHRAGWYNLEGSAASGYYWTKKDAIFAVTNPRKDCVFYVEVDNPSTQLDMPQQVTISLGPALLDQFSVVAMHPVLRRIPISAGAWGNAGNVELKISVDKTFTPKNDPRELGIRVLHAAVMPNS